VSLFFCPAPSHGAEDVASLPGLSYELAVLESEELVFAASKRVEAVHTAPMAISIVTAERIDSIPARYLPQVLRLLPGVDVLQITRSEFTVGIRGFANQGNFRPRDVLVLVDGRTIYDHFSGNIEWEILDIFPQDVAKVEVIRGGGSAIHGANAARGVINILTKPPEAVSPFEAQTTVATRNGFRQRLAAGGASSPYSWTVSGGFDQSDLWDRFENRSLSDDRGEQTWRVHTQGERRLDSGGVMRAIAGLNHGKIRQHNTSGTLVDNHQSTRHIQIEYERPSLSVRSFWTARDVDKGQFTAGVFADEQFNATDRLLLRIAARLDHHPETRGQISPRAGLTYQMHPEHLVKGSVSLGYRNPTISNNFFDFPVGPSRIVGNRDLKPEESLWYEVGYLWQSGIGVTAGLDTYYVTSNDLIEASFVPPLVSFSNSDEDVAGYGGELWAENRLRPSVRVIANYAHSHFRQDSQDIDLTSPHKANAGLLISGASRVTGAITAHFVAATISPFSISGSGIGGEPVDSYVVANAFLAYRVTDLVGVKLDVFNLTNSVHREFSLGEEIPIEVNATIQITL
jgi:outer membrane receptor for ferrienterochelin and colicin